MSKLFVINCFFALFISCQGEKKQAIDEESKAFKMSIERWSKIINITAKTKEVLNDWPEYNALETSFKSIYKVASTEDLSLVLDDLIDQQKALESSKYPEVFDKAQIRTRQKVFKTYILKTKGDLIYSLDMNTSVAEMIDAYNALLKEMNIITSNTLDLKRILEEDTK